MRKSKYRNLDQEPMNLKEAWFKEQDPALKLAQVLEKSIIYKTNSSKKFLQQTSIHQIQLSLKYQPLQQALVMESELV